MFNKLTKILAAVTIGVMSFFATNAYVVNNEPMVVHAEDGTNILDNVKMEGGKVSLTKSATDDTGETFNAVYSKYKTILNGVIGLVTITLVLLFVIQCAKLGASADNAAKRSTSIGALLWIGIAAGLLGAVYTFIGLFYNVFNG